MMSTTATLHQPYRLQCQQRRKFLGISPAILYSTPQHDLIIYRFNFQQDTSSTTTHSRTFIGQRFLFSKTKQRSKIAKQSTTISVGCIPVNQTSASEILHQQQSVIARTSNEDSPFVMYCDNAATSFGHRLYTAQRYHL